MIAENSSQRGDNPIESASMRTGVKDVVTRFAYVTYSTRAATPTGIGEAPRKRCTTVCPYTNHAPTTNTA
jgi:hypothetical protein